MIASVNMDEKILVREKEADEISEMMIDNINLHLEEKEQKERAKEQGQDSSWDQHRTMSALRIISWTKDIQTVSLVQAIKEHLTGSLIQAKAEVDRLIEGEPIELHFDDEEKKEKFREIAGSLGVILE